MHEKYNKKIMNFWQFLKSLIKRLLRPIYNFIYKNFTIWAAQVSILFVKNLTLIKVNNSSDSLFTWAEFDWFELSKAKYDSDFFISSCTPILIIKISDGYDLTCDQTKVIKRSWFFRECSDNFLVDFPTALVE